MKPDVLVVGGGLAGLSVAWHLATDHRVVVLEQGPQPGAEASAQNAGMVRRLIEDPYERQLAFAAHRFYENPPDDWAGLTCSRVTGALLALAYDPHALHDAVAHGAEFGVRAQLCDRPDEVAPALVGSPVKAAWYLPDERVADSGAVVTGLLRGLARMGAEVRCQTTVTGLVRRGDRIVGVQTADGKVEAGAVVLATGAWSGVWAEKLGLERPLFALRRAIVHTQRHPLSTAEQPWVWIDDAGIYMRPEAGGWLGSPCDEALDPPGLGPGSTRSAQPTAFALASEKLARWLPALAGARWKGGWSGLRTFAPDRLPVLGRDPAVDGLWWATALGGFGVTCGFAVGDAVATWMRGEQTPWLFASAMAPGRYYMKRWPIRPDGDLHGSLMVDGR